MECPTPCVCGEIVELHDMHSIAGSLPNGGNLVCDECYCEDCNGEGECLNCEGGLCSECGRPCTECKGSGQCGKCHGQGYVVGDPPAATEVQG